MRNPQYEHVQSKLYNPTVSHEMKRTSSRSRGIVQAKANQIKQQREEEFKNEHSFQPQINKNYKSKRDSREALTQEEKLQRLAQPVNQKVLMRDQIKTQKEIEEVQRYCTFKPELYNYEDIKNKDPVQKHS